MKTLIKGRIFVVLFVILSGLSVAQAGIFALDNVIGDEFLGNSGDATELAGLEAAIFAYNGTIVDLQIESKVDTVPADVISNGVADEWYLDIAPSTPGYFLLKFGTGSFPAGTSDTYYFENLPDLTKLVWSDAQVNNLSGSCGSGKCNTGRLSHYTTAVPVPAAAWLFGSGLVGLFGVSRRKSTSALQA